MNNTFVFKNLERKEIVIEKHKNSVAWSLPHGEYGKSKHMQEATFYYECVSN